MTRPTTGVCGGHNDGSPRHRGPGHRGRSPCLRGPRAVAIDEGRRWMRVQPRPAPRARRKHVATGPTRHPATTARHARTNRATVPIGTAQNVGRVIDPTFRTRLALEQIGRAYPSEQRKTWVGSSTRRSMHGRRVGSMTRPTDLLVRRVDDPSDGFHGWSFVSRRTAAAASVSLGSTATARRYWSSASRMRPTCSKATPRL